MQKVKVLIEPAIIKRPPQKPEEKSDTKKEADKQINESKVRK